MVELLMVLLGMLWVSDTTTLLVITVCIVGILRYSDVYSSRTHIVTSSLVTYSTPATTSVAACITADTEVGPSIASGNQLCIPITTLLILTMANRIQSTTLLCLRMYSWYYRIL